MSEYAEWKESDVIRRFGVPKDELVAFRKSALLEGKDWERPPVGKRPIHTCPIVYTQEGFKLVAERFGLIEVHASLKPGEPAEVKVMNPAEAEPEMLSAAEVVRCDYPNRRIMLIRLEDGKQVFCVVYDSTRFKPRLPIAVKYRGGRYYCEHRPTSLLRINQLLKRNAKP